MDVTMARLLHITVEKPSKVFVHLNAWQYIYIKGLFQTKENKIMIEGISNELP